jgi:hypothetical protein
VAEDFRLALQDLTASWSKSPRRSMVLISV